MRPLPTFITALSTIALAGTAAAQCSTQRASHAGWSDSSCNEPKQTTVLVADHQNAAEMDIVDTAVNAGSFTILAKALEAADLIDALKAKGPFTVFAPTDAAFGELPEGTIEKLLKPENKDLLIAILTYHVVPANVKAEKAVTLEFAPTLNGQRIDLAVRRETLTLNEHTNVIATDIAATNGTIHVIDRVIMPETKTIVGVAAENGSFDTLLTAAKAAGLAELLNGDEPYTVFAPTDEAFAALGSRTIESLLMPENRDRLAGILKLHVVPGRVYADQVVKAGTAKTANGQRVSITQTPSGVTVNGASVIIPDVQASNGVIHVIDRVILPE